MRVEPFPRSRAAFFIVDANYFGLAILQAQQALEMSSEVISIHVFLEGDERETDRERHRFEGLQGRSNGRLFLHRNELTPRVPDSFPHTANLPKLVYGRFFAPEILEAERIVYLDVDILIRGRLDDIFSANMGAHPVAAVHDYGFVSNPPTDEGDPISALRASGDYFNAGVLLIDRARWLKSDLDAQARAFFAEHGEKATLQDQDFLNWIYRDNWAQLSPRWNFQAALMSAGLHDALAPEILHFSGSLKPWHAECRTLIPGFTEEFRGCAARAGVSPDWRPQKGRVTYQKPLRSLRYRLRTIAASLGLKSRREAKRLDEWRMGRQRCVMFLDQMEKRGGFADPVDFHFGLPEPEPIYDGRHYWAAA